MNKDFWKLLWNPFEKIAGGTALGIGLAALCCSALINSIFGWHYHGLLNIAPGPESGYLIYLGEQLIIWLVPAVIFFIGGLILSSSRIRIIDVFGTVAFSFLPLVPMNLLQGLPGFKALQEINPELSIRELMELPALYWGTLIAVGLMIFLVWTFIWMFKALQVSCNLKGWRIWVVYLIGVFIGDIITVQLIRLLY
ncbi:MAG: hypothetical protein LUH15_00835 [Tannerellaceae bacterium]|nr:hypothetical protein [Tannerellaceae bacterium]